MKSTKRKSLIKEYHLQLDNNFKDYEIIIYVEGRDDYFFYKKILGKYRGIGIRFLYGATNYKVLEDDFNLRNFNPEKIYIILDHDKAGKHLIRKNPMITNKNNIPIIKWTLKNLFPEINKEDIMLETVLWNYGLIERLLLDLTNKKLSKKINCDTFYKGINSIMKLYNNTEHDEEYLNYRMKKEDDSKIKNGSCDEFLKKLIGSRRFSSRMRFFQYKENIIDDIEIGPKLKLKIRTYIIGNDWNFKI